MAIPKRALLCETYNQPFISLIYHKGFLYPLGCPKSRCDFVCPGTEMSRVWHVHALPSNQGLVNEWLNALQLLCH